MKRVTILLMAFAFFGTVIGQTVVKSNYVAFAGTAADTVTASATKAYTLDFGASGGWAGKVFDYTIQLFADRVSGTGTFAVKLYESVDGATWTATAIDSTSHSHTTDFVYVKTESSRTARYVKLAVIGTSATQNIRLYGYVSVGKHY